MLKKLAQTHSVICGGTPESTPLESRLLPPPPPCRHLCVSVSAFPKAVLAPSAILRPLQHPPKMLLLLPEAGRPALSPGHSPPSGAPGPPTGVRTTRLPSPTPALPTSSASALTQLLSAPMATPVPSPSPLGTLRPPSRIQEKVVVTPSLPRGPEATQLAPGPSACWHLGAMHESGSRWTEPGCSQCWCEVGVRGPPGFPGLVSGALWWLELQFLLLGWGGDL